jgi:hypothetical protein
MAKIGSALPADTSSFGPLFQTPTPPRAPRRRGRKPMASTSIEAHRQVDHSGDEATILKLLETPGTLDEVSELLDRPAHALSGRFTSLASKGLIEHSGERRLTRSGAKANVWQLKRKS